MTTVTSPPRLFDLSRAPAREDSQDEAAKTEQREEEAAGQCSARPGADDAATRRFAAAYGRCDPIRLESSDGGRLTLEARLDRVWEGLSAVGAAPCVVCRGRLERTAAGEGRCVSCGSVLS
jgi:hypothetical protein